MEEREKQRDVKAAIEIEGLTKTYGKSRGVEGISFTVEEGDIFGFLGPNGAGKSTTIRSMLGLLTFSEGTIKLLQMDSKKRQKQILRQVGYMPSEAFIYPSMKVKEVVRFAAQARKQDCAKEAERLCEILEVDREKRSGNCLSATGKKSALSAQCSIDRSY